MISISGRDLIAKSVQEFCETTSVRGVGSYSLAALVRHVRGKWRELRASGNQLKSQANTCSRILIACLVSTSCLFGTNGIAHADDYACSRAIATKLLTQVPRAADEVNTEWRGDWGAAVGSLCGRFDGRQDIVATIRPNGLRPGIDWYVFSPSEPGKWHLIFAASSRNNDREIAQAAKQPSTLMIDAQDELTAAAAHQPNLPENDDLIEYWTVYDSLDSSSAHSSGEDYLRIRWVDGTFKVVERFHLPALLSPCRQSQEGEGSASEEGYRAPTDFSSVITPVADAPAVAAYTLNWGMRLREIRTDPASQPNPNFSSEKEVMISTVEPDSPAAAAGLHPGDIVLEFDNNKVTAVSQLIASVHQAENARRAALLLISRYGVPNYLVINP
jgi:hypothetical protein